jgi:hypothetical protein
VNADRFEELKRRFGLADLLGLAQAEDLRHRGSGRNRSECPACRNGDVRGVSIGEKDGVGLWRCFRDEQHGGTALDFLMHARGLSLADAAAELERRVGLTGNSTPPLPRRPSAPPSRPPAAEVAQLWAQCRPLSFTPDVAAAWEARGLDIAAIEDRDLARALPSGIHVPRWAWGPHGRWGDPYRLIVPMFDAAGHIVSLHARAAAGATPKGLSPAGHAIAGTVMADALALRMLAGEAPDQLRRGGLLVAEGVPDFLTWATHWGDAADNAPAVMAVIAGSWTAEIGARVPDGVRVGIATHDDAAGEKYAREVARTLSRRCHVVRIRLAEAA